MDDDYISIDARHGDTINLSLHSDGIWLSMFKGTSYASTMLTMDREPVIISTPMMDSTSGIS